MKDLANNVAKSYGRHWHHLHIMAMTAAECTCCGELSDPVAIPANWKSRPARQHMIDVAFEKIGWVVEPRKAWCPTCKTLPR